MLKSITKIGNSQGLILDAALLELSGLKVGDQVNVTVHEGGAITLTPMRPGISAADAAKAARDLIRRNRELFKRLA
jgi:antitoxin component of MazEF toxin-antitoxin module